VRSRLTRSTAIASPTAPAASSAVASTFADSQLLRETAKGTSREKIGNGRALTGKNFSHMAEASNSLVTKTAEFGQASVASVLQHRRAGVLPMMTNQTQIKTEVNDLATRARAEFREMPGMCLTTAQAARLWQLSPARAEELLSELVQAGFLVRRDGQKYRLPSAV
jgi:hypothetical protein